MSMDKCKVCGGDLNLSDSFCPQCGFEHHILPEPVSNEVRMYEEKRINACKKVWEEHKQGYENLKKNYEAEVSKNKKIEQDLNDSRIKEQATKKENERNKTLLEKANKELSSLHYKNQGLVDNVQSLTSQNQSLKTERDLALKEIEKLKQNPPASGAQLKIIEEYGKYRLYDVSGVVRRSNGTAIGKSGIELYDGYVFYIGDVSFKVSTPEFNIDNLIL